MVELLIETSNREKNNEKSKYAIEKRQYIGQFNYCLKWNLSVPLTLLHHKKDTKGKISLVFLKFSF